MADGGIHIRYSINRERTSSEGSKQESYFPKSAYLYFAKVSYIQSRRGRGRIRPIIKSFHIPPKYSAATKAPVDRIWIISACGCTISISIRESISFRKGKRWKIS